MEHNEQKKMRDQYKKLMKNSGLYSGAIEAISETLCDFGNRFLSELEKCPDEIFSNVYGTYFYYYPSHQKFGEVVEFGDCYSDEYFQFVNYAEFKVLVESLLSDQLVQTVSKIQASNIDRGPGEDL